MTTITPTAEQGGQVQAEITVEPWFADRDYDCVLRTSTSTPEGTNLRSTIIFLNAADRAALRKALA